MIFFNDLVLKAGCLGLLVFRKLKKFIPVIKFFVMFKSISVYINYLIHENGKFLYSLSICAILKNEADYIKEWIEYHRIAGADHFYLYDDNSTDNLLDILKPYIDEGIVTYKKLNGEWMQVLAYNNAIKKYKNKSKWMAFIDIDEFIVPLNKEKIQNVLDYVENTVVKRKIFGMIVYTVSYGYSGHYNKPSGLVIENYTKSDGIDVFKTIVNPRSVVTFCGAHTAIHFFNTALTNEKGIPFENELYRKGIDLSIASVDSIRINHYRTKSYEEYKTKIERNSKKQKNHGIVDGYTMIEYVPDYFSSKEDMVMGAYVEVLHQRLKIV
ncbi:MAG: hypothetical protein Ta2B_09090 [Termitinemataceae bacterium]|nr:MAG: hypothetical protein Ta2B_09090 [Termitinemataceae bacterium]